MTSQIKGSASIQHNQDERESTEVGEGLLMNVSDYARRKRNDQVESDNQDI